MHFKKAFTLEESYIHPFSQQKIGAESIGTHLGTHIPAYTSVPLCILRHRERIPSKKKLLLLDSFSFTVVLF